MVPVAVVAGRVLLLGEATFQQVAGSWLAMMFGRCRGQTLVGASARRGRFQSALWFCPKTAVPLGLRSDNAVLLSARQLALVRIVPGRVEAKLRIPVFLHSRRPHGGTTLADVKMSQVKVINSTWQIRFSNHGSSDPSL